MPIWKKSIFVNAITTLMGMEDKSANVVIERYTKLTEEEKTEILSEFK